MKNKKQLSDTPNLSTKVEGARADDALEILADMIAERIWREQSQGSNNENIPHS